MDRLKRAALLTRLIFRLREKGSWCGETHIQKSTLFLQELRQVPLGFDFILYKHGPFSFGLREELTSLRADELIQLEAQWPYGPRISTTDRSRYIQDVNSKAVAIYDNDIIFVSERLGGRSVAELERLATAFFVTQYFDGAASNVARASELTRLKPHILLEDSTTAFEEVDRIIADARS